MPKTKEHGFTNQHIVPKSYLDRFATKTENRKYRLGVVPRNGKPFINSTNNIGYKKNYYDIPFIEDTKAWEHFYSAAIEGPCSKAMDNLIIRINMSAPKLFQLTYYDKIYLSLFIISQITRVPAFIDYWQKHKSQEIFSNTKAKILEENASILSEEMIEVINKVNFTEEEIKQMILSNINDPRKIKKYCTILLNRTWCVCFNAAFNDVPFITSDNPEVLINYVDGVISNTQNGIGRKDTDIYFPLTPKISIMLLARGDRELDNIDSHMLIFDNSMVKTVEFFNNIEIKNCTDQVFYPLEYYNLKYGN